MHVENVEVLRAMELGRRAIGRFVMGRRGIMGGVSLFWRV